VYNLISEIEFDPAKNASNRIKHGIDMARAELFDMDTAVIEVDRRREYGETRYVAIGYLEQRLHVMVFAMVTGPRLRIISLRKANRREQREHEQS